MENNTKIEQKIKTLEIAIQNLIKANTTVLTTQKTTIDTINTITKTQQTLLKMILKLQKTLKTDGNTKQTYIQ